MRFLLLILFVAHCSAAFGQERPLPDDFDPSEYGSYSPVGDKLRGSLKSGLRALRGSLFLSERNWRLKAEEGAERIVEVYFEAQLASFVHREYAELYADLLIDGDEGLMGLRDFFSQRFESDDRQARLRELAEVLLSAFDQKWKDIEEGRVLAGRETYSNSVWKARKRALFAGALPLPTAYYSSHLLYQLARTVFVRVPAWWELSIQGHLYRMNRALRLRAQAKSCAEIMVRLRNRADFENSLRRFGRRQKFWVPTFVGLGSAASVFLYFKHFEGLHKWDEQEDVYKLRIRPFLKQEINS